MSTQDKKTTYLRVCTFVPARVNRAAGLRPASVLEVRKLLGQRTLLLLLCLTASSLFAGSIDGTLDHEGRAWSEKTDTGVEAGATGGWATISGGGEAFYYFYLPYTAQEDLTQLHLYWYGQRTDVLGQGAVILVYDSNSAQWHQIAIDNNSVEGWRGSFFIPSDYLSVFNGSSRVLEVQFKTGLLDTYRLKTVRLNFSHTDWSLEQGDLEAAYACSLATVQTDRFFKMVSEYDLWDDSNDVDGDLFWMWAASVYQFANHLAALDAQSLTDLIGLPAAIQGLYEDIFGLQLFEVIDVALLKDRYMGLHIGGDGGPVCFSMAPTRSVASYLSDLNSSLRKAARRLGGFTLDAGSSREGCLEEFYQVLDSCSVDYFGIPSSRSGSFAYHGDKWEFYWNFAADGVVVEDVNKMGRKAAEGGAIMEEFGDAWLDSFVTVQVTTDPPGLNVHVNGTYYAASPVSWHSLKGTSHTIGAYPQILHEGKTYYFTGWSDCGTQIHTVAPTSNVTYVAHYQDADLSDDGTVNFEDFARLANHWMGSYCVGTVKTHQKISDTQGNFTGGIDAGDLFGGSIANIGDLNGDGVTDIVVGAYGDDDAVDNAGAIWVLFIDSNGVVKGHQKITESIGGFTGDLRSWDNFGISVTSLGDLDGDDVTDIAVGAYLDDDGGNDTGAVWVIFLNSDGTVKAHQKISALTGGFTGTLDASDHFGVSVAGLGDVNGDGVTDIAVGAHQDDDGGYNTGAVWVLFLNADGTVKGHQKISPSYGNFMGVLDNEDYFGGYHITCLGDLDNDGVSDLAVPAYRDDDGGTDRGAVWVLFLNSDGTVKGHQKISDTQGNFTGDLHDGDVFGVSVSSMGDLNGDGVTDLAVGADLDDDGGDQRGAVWILFLNTDGTVKSHQKISSTKGNFTGDLDDGDYFGRSVTSLGDLDGDGICDITVGAHRDGDGGYESGAVWILFLHGCNCEIVGDLDGDCAIGWIDVKMLVDDWL